MELLLRVVARPTDRTTAVAPVGVNDFDSRARTIYYNIIKQSNASSAGERFGDRL